MSAPNHAGEVFQGGATTSQHIDAENDDHFENTTFKLKRTRSLGLLDEFIDPEKQEQQIEQHNTDRALASLSQLSEVQPPSESPSASSGPELAEPAGSAANTTNTNGPSTTSPTPPFIRSPELIPHDDSDLVAEPSRHVDYLSYQWDIDDISKSWRYVILRRKNVANAARLENASWRTWAQRRCNLKTINPEEVNWLKESDVTWLYGPIVDDDDHDHDGHSSDDPKTCNTASSVVAGDISIARKNHGPKPILKRRTVEELMISHLNLLKLEVATARAEQEQRRREDADAQRRREAHEKSGTTERPPEYFDYDVISAKLNSQYKSFSQQNSANNSSANLAAKNYVPPTADQLAAKFEKAREEKQNQEEQESTTLPLLLQQTLSVLSVSTAKEKRHIHFNDEVQQCIAIEEYSGDDDEYDDYDDDEDNDYMYGDNESYIYESHNREYDSEGSEDEDEDNDHGDDDDDDDDDDDEGGFFLRVRSPSSASIPGFTLPGLSSSANKGSAKENENSEDTESISTNNSKVYKTIHLLPPTTLNYGTSDEESDDSNPYTSSMSHNIDNSSRAYDYYYDYNTVYQVDPNHSIYGAKKTPDVLDVPENIGIGSNFDYEIIENEDIDNLDSPPLEMVGRSERSDPMPAASGASNTSSDRERLPISSLEDSASQHHVRRNPFSIEASDSESEDDEEGGLSICTKSSSHSLAQLVFGPGMTSTNDHGAENHYPQEILKEREPDSKHISSINPRYSSTELSKQPHSSSSLSDQFFSSGMTKATDNTLSELFFNSPQTESVSSPMSQTFSGTQSPPVQSKTSPLPPQTTSANAFLGRGTPPLPKPQSKKAFIFDSDSETEDEFIEDVNPPSSGENAGNPSSYASLYQVADRNGITAASPDTDDGGNQKNKVGLAMANFLGSWNKGN